MLIGSRAYAYWVPSFRLTPEKDWDLITDTLPMSDQKIEIQKLDFLISGEFLKFATNDVVSIGGIDYPVCSLRGLAALKLSHLSLDYRWVKHISFWHKYLKPHFNQDDWELVKRREKLTLIYANQKNPSLSMTNVDFFDDFVSKKYDHDYLHELVAFYDAPLYTKLKFSNKQELAWCEKILWDEFTHEDKLKCICEESSTIALERFLLPQREKYPNVAYYKALQKVCTSLTSGWFREYAIWNWDSLMKMCRTDLLQEITNNLKY